ncbi:MAG TPA: type II secretion system protein GspM [Burkholderiales bacterium]|jgi:MSHA biogenesis protein MshJ|nr:type II secretion system protein GspM [Burkholderiales bacterium]
MNETWRKVVARFDALKPRERAMVFAAGAVVIGWLVFMMAIDNELARYKRLNADLSRQQTTLAQLQTQIAELMRAAAQDPDAAGRARIAALTRQLAQFDTDLRDMQRGLVPPTRMARVLEDVLTRNSQVHLVKLRTLPVTALVDRDAKGEPVRAETQGGAERLIYKHGIELTLEGGYLDLLDYLTRLEKLPWQMFWARTRIDASRYPRVQMTVTLYTLSLDEAWLVV